MTVREHMLRDAEPTNSHTMRRGEKETVKPNSAMHQSYAWGTDMYGAPDNSLNAWESNAKNEVIRLAYEKGVAGPLTVYGKNLHCLPLVLSYIICDVILCDLRGGL